MIYLDNAATTKMSEPVLNKVTQCMADCYGNPGSLHRFGLEARAAVDEARGNVAKFIGSSPEQILFTSSGSEANSLALIGLKEYLTGIGKTHLIVSKIEHGSVLEAAARLANDGFTIDYVYPDSDGVVSASAVESLLSDDTGLVCVMYVNNELGSRSEVEAIGELCSQTGVLFMTDAVQAAGSLEIDVNKLNCDLLTISSHKIHGPKGVGALYCKDMSKLKPIIFGGSSQEFGKRGGTEDVPNICGFGEACRQMKYNSTEFIVGLRKKEFLQSLKKELDALGLSDRIRVNAKSDEGPGKILSVTFSGIDGETLLLLLSNQGICASAGSACNSSEHVPSHVLKAIGLSDEDARSTIRFSFSVKNASDNMDQAGKIVARCVNTLAKCGGSNGGETQEENSNQ